MITNMKSRSPYAIFLNMVVASRKTSPDPEFAGCEEILAFIAERNSQNQSVRITDLVQYVEFGTGPTVHRKCKLLVSKGFVKVEQDCTDKRANVISITLKGRNHLEKYSQMMKMAIEEAVS